MNNSYSGRLKVELFVSARKLKNVDILSKSDPRMKLYYKEGRQGSSTCLGQTEVVSNDLNPNWKTSFQLDYIFEIHQVLRFEVWDSDSSINDDMIGMIDVTLGEIMGAKDSVMKLKLQKNGEKSGKLIVKADQVKIDNSYVLWQWRAEKLMNTDGIFGTSDPFLIFFRKKGSETIRIHETPFIKDNLNPAWQPFELNMGKLDRADRNQSFRVECWDNSKSGKHNFIGYIEMSFNDIMKKEMRKWNLSNPNEKHPGILILHQYNTYIKPTFVDYIRGGEQINLMVAIDFTGSNGEPHETNSLHYLKEGQKNQYETALNLVSEILLNYDNDKKVPVYGFGAVPHFPNHNSINVEHCFPLTGDINNPEVIGLDGIIKYYKGALQNVELSGPTYFAPLLEYAIKTAEMNRSKDIYTVLLILTDGEIHDMQQSVDLIMKCSQLPISIIIVGVGNEPFVQMKKLDGDDGPLKKTNNKEVHRDLVQFIAYKDYKMNIQKLPEAVLSELPRQFCQYMRLVNKMPKQAKMIDLFTI